MLDATIGRLVKQHEPTARAVERLLEQRPLAELERDQLLTVVEQLLASGWHGWEAAGAFWRLCVSQRITLETSK